MKKIIISFNLENPFQYKNLRQKVKTKFAYLKTEFKLKDLKIQFK